VLVALILNINGEITMNAFIIVLTVIDAMVALLLIGVVLIQQSKDGGLGGAAFGGAGSSVFGGQAADHLAKITVVLSSIFLILTLSLAIITGRRNSDEARLVDDKNAPTELTATPVEKKVNAALEDKKLIEKLDDIKQVKPKVEKKVIKTEKAVEEKTAVPVKSVPETK
jgi:preprotein translocase subunit SecG